jgi:hypothetical protein
MLQGLTFYNDVQDYHSEWRENMIPEAERQALKLMMVI